MWVKGIKPRGDERPGVLLTVAGEGRWQERGGGRTGELAGKGRWQEWGGGRRGEGAGKGRGGPSRSVITSRPGVLLTWTSGVAGIAGRGLLRVWRASCKCSKQAAAISHFWFMDLESHPNCRLRF